MSGNAPRENLYHIARGMLAACESQEPGGRHQQCGEVAERGIGRRTSARAREARAVLPGSVRSPSCTSM